MDENLKNNTNYLFNMRLIFTSFFLFFFFLSNAQINSDHSKVILITLDGLRWQELFSGADPQLINNKKYVDDTTALKELFWKSTAKKRRETLMPFVWNIVAKKGQIHGNRTLGSTMNLTNAYWFSYPGYNEILTGKSDDERINSNSKKPNPNKTILEVVNTDSRYKGKVAAFGSWDVFPYIINESRSKVPVNAGFEEAKGENLSSNEHYLNKLQKATPSPWNSVRLDVFTHHYALEYLKNNQPDFIYIAYGETDDFAHHGDYDAYLKAAHRTDSFIKELWEFVENNPYYKDNTTFIITTDHGRGTEPIDTWRSHGRSVNGADEVWLMTFGKGVKPLGEIAIKRQLYTNQIAASIAKLFHVDIENAGDELDFILNED